MIQSEPERTIGVHSLAENLRNKLINESILSKAQAMVVEDMLIELLTDMEG
mgnify:CR=1 FL=1